MVSRSWSVFQGDSWSALARDFLRLNGPRRHRFGDVQIEPAPPHQILHDDHGITTILWKRANARLLTVVMKNQHPFNQRVDRSGYLDVLRSSTEGAFPRLAYFNVGVHAHGA